MKLRWTAPALALLTCAALPTVAAPTRQTPPAWAAPSVKRVVAKKIMQPGPDGNFNGSKAVTRYELAVTLDRLVRYFEASQKPLTPAPRAGAVTLPKDAPAPVMQALSHLAAGGYLRPKSPLLTKPGNQPVTAKELADVLAQVTVRLSDRSLPPQSD
jgi:hypothetical protein